MEAKHWLLFILLIAAVVRVCPLEVYAEWDEAVYLQHAENIIEGKNNYLEHEIRPLLLSVIITPALLLWDSIFSAQILINLLSALIVIPVFYLGKELKDEKTGLISSLLVAVYPLFVRNGHMILTDSVAATFLAGMLCLSLKSDWRSAGFAGLLGGLAVLTKFTSLAPVFVIGVYLLWKQDLKKIISFSFVFGATISPYLAWSWMKFGHPFHVFISQKNIASTASSSIYFLDVFAPAFVAGLVLYFLLSKIDREYLAVSAAWVLLTCLGIATVHFESRYLIPVLIPLLPLSGLGWSLSVKKWRWNSFVIVSCLILVLSAPAFSYFQYYPVAEWKSDVIKAAEELEDAEVIYATSYYPLYGYYTNAVVKPVHGDRLEDYYPRIMPEPGFLVLHKDSDPEHTLEWAKTEPRLTHFYENKKVIVYEHRYR